MSRSQSEITYHDGTTSHERGSDGEGIDIGCISAFLEDMGSKLREGLSGRRGRTAAVNLWQQWSMRLLLAHDEILRLTWRRTYSFA